MSRETLTPALSLEPTSCGLCGSDEAEPVAVGEDFRTAGSRDTYLAVRCSACGLLYLTPVPATPPAAPTPSPGAEALSGPLGTSSRRRVWRAIDRWMGGFPADARLLMVGSSPAVQPDRPLAGRATHRTPDELAAEPSQSAHGALLIGALEELAGPVETLRGLHRVLRPDGCLLVVATNPDSLAAGLFRGRHWSGYDFPRRRTLAGPAILRTLVERAGFKVEALSTLGDPGAWIESAAYLLRDWGASPRIARLCSSRPVTMLAGALERLAALSGRGGLIRAVLRRGQDDGPSR